MYIILEMQTYADGNIGTLVFTRETRLEAESKYHEVLAAAAISSLPMHAAVLMTNEGNVISHQSYTHEA